MHYGVKGMKWGVRHDKPSLGRRYSNWGRSVSNKRYDRASSNIEKRRQKRLNENFLRNTRYGKAVDRISNKNYDKAQKRVEERRTRKNQEFDSFDRGLDKIDNKKNSIRSKVSKSINNTKRELDSTYGKISPKQKYNKPSSFFKKAGKNVVQNYKDGADFYKKSFKSIKNKKPKEIGKHYVDWLNQDVEVLGVTGSKKMKRGRYISGVYNPFY